MYLKERVPHADLRTWANWYEFRWVLGDRSIQYGKASLRSNLLQIEASKSFAAGMYDHKAGSHRLLNAFVGTFHIPIEHNRIQALHTIGFEKFRQRSQCDLSDNRRIQRFPLCLGSCCFYNAIFRFYVLV